ncbi:MAG TPA: MFS transporter [Jatrophihabitantaceae bacterium]|nr:MFS transporter [Jatrophihabitantaceae bacterium]
MTGRQRMLALYVLCSGMLMIVLDVSIVNVALPSIQDELGFSSAGLAWVVNAYLIAFGGLLLLAGRIGDLFGRRRVFLIGLAVFTAASAVCGVAQSPGLLVVARFVQGAGGALTSAVILGMIVTMFPEPREQAQAIGVYAFVASAGGAVGALAGGTITQWVSWHWIFFVNVPIGIAGAVLAARTLPVDGEAPATRPATDVIGALLITAALTLGVYTIVVPAAELGWGAGNTLACVAIAIAMLVAFLVREATTPLPLIPMRILRSRTVAGSNLMQVFGAGGMFGAFFLGALYLQHVLRYDPLEIGLAFLPVSVLMGGLSIRYSERLVTRYGVLRVMVPGMVSLGAGLALFAVAPADGSYVRSVLPVMVLLGIGAGLAFPPLMSLAMSGVDPADAGLASGLINTTGQVGGAIGLAVLATASAGRTADLHSGGASTAAALTGGYHLAFWIAAAMIGAAVVVALTVVRPARQAQPADVELAAA